MAENTDNEETPESSEVVEKPAETVKKKAAKKRVAKKKAAKKKTASKKTAVKKAQDAASAPEGKGDAKPATATAVAAAAAGDTRPPSHTETVIKARLIKDEPPEVTAMSTESTSAGSFWVKVIFWVVIIVLGFIYIRTLAKHPGEQSVAPKSEESHEEAVTAPTTSSQMTAPFDLSVGKESETLGSRAADSGDASSAVGGESVAGDTETKAGVEHPAVQPPAAVEQRSTITESGGAAAPAGDADSASTGEAAAAADRQSMRARHEESVARILKEFDDLREAARAEMEAMHNLMQAEQELRDAMAPSPPPVYPGWRGPESGYGPYGPPPQNYPPY